MARIGRTKDGYRIDVPELPWIVHAADIDGELQIISLMSRPGAPSPISPTTVDKDLIARIRRTVAALGHGYRFGVPSAFVEAARQPKHNLGADRTEPDARLRVVGAIVREREERGETRGHAKAVRSALGVGESNARKLIKEARDGGYVDDASGASMEELPPQPDPSLLKVAKAYNADGLPGVRALGLKKSTGCTADELVESAREAGYLPPSK